MSTQDKNHADRMAEIERRNKRVISGVFAVVFAMVALSYAAVPLYSLFCSVTGYAGTTARVDANTAHAVLDRPVTIRFETQTAPGMPWSFRSEIAQMTLNVGEDGFMNFRAHNPSSRPVTGTAIFNVTPAKAGKYFKKVQCFCFDRQTLTSGQSVNMPVQFYVDPAIAADRFLDDVKTITLSYTFFHADSQELEDAIDATYPTPGSKTATGPKTEEKVIN